MPFAFFQVVDGRETADDTLGRDHSQNIKTPDDRAGVSHESLVPSALARDMSVGGFEADEILMMEILDLGGCVATNLGE